MDLELLQEYKCRYCLESTNEEDMVSPCRCSGSLQYVHKECLKDWFKHKNNTYVIPGKFNQFETYGCEICNTKYRCEYANTVIDGSISCKIFQYVSIVTISLFCSYVGIGYLMNLSDSTKNLFTFVETDYFINLLWNGFCMTHLILGLFYIIAFLSNSSSCFCLYFMVPDVNMNNSSNDDSCVIVLIFILLIISVIVTVTIIYMDIISRVVQREKNRRLTILDIYDYEEGQA